MTMIPTYGQLGQVRQPPEDQRLTKNQLFIATFLSSRWYRHSMNPGDKLHQLLRERIGVDTTKECNCDEKRILMNMWGPDNCRKNLDWIVSGLLDEAQKRNWQIENRPLLSLAARLGTMVPWGIAYARAWARSLVTEAIDACERN